MVAQRVIAHLERSTEAAASSDRRFVLIVLRSRIDEQVQAMLDMLLKLLSAANKLVKPRPDQLRLPS